MEKKVLFTELDDRGSHLRKEITPTAVVTDKRRFPTAQFWDANKTYDVIVADATSASDTLEKAEENLNNEIARATNAENALSDRIDDLLGIDALGILDLKQIVEDLDPETGILSVIEQKVNSADLATVATTGSYNDLLDKPDLSLKANVEDISTTELVYENNNHEYVDLGLPSGTCWSATNLGASSETEYGSLYRWGAVTTGASLNTEGTDSTYVLPKTKDAASYNLHGEWCIPTKEQFEELIANTSQSFKSNYKNSGIDGVLFVAPNGNSIFFPNAGYEDYGSIQGRTYWGFYWSSTASTSTEAYQLANHEVDNWNPIISVIEDYPKRCKLPIRPVLKLTEQQILGKTVTDEEKATWNAKANASDVYTKAEIDQMLLQLANS